ncbi:MAG: hypothetical protein WC205_13445 [Opitutaceae bacterium]|jgi:hypothetical protein
MSILAIHTRIPANETQTMPVGSYITNPGFEDGLSPWGIDNWARNDVTCERGTDNPHSGKYSMMVRLNQVLRSAGGVTLAVPVPKVTPGTAVLLRFWARGVSNGASLQLLFRQDKPPVYPTFSQTEIGLTEIWQEYTYMATLPADVDPGVTSVRFRLSRAGVFWLDDVRLTEMPTVEGGAAATTNPIRNPSFEVGTDGWTATMRQREWPKDQAWHETGSFVPSPVGAKLQSIDDGTAPQGRSFLSFEMPPEGSVTYLTSAYFPARYGHKMILKLSVRSEADHSFHVGVASGKGEGVVVNDTQQTASTKWRTVTIPLTLKPASDGLFFLFFQFGQPGRYDIDAVSIMEEGVDALVLYPTSTAIESTEGTPVANLYEPRQEARFKLVTAGGEPGATTSYHVSVADFLERNVATLNVEVTANADGYGEQTFGVPTDRLGAFRIEAHRDGATFPLAEQLYSVLPPLAPPSERPDSYFGAHIDLTPYNLEIARKAGFRWLRLYPPLNTKWIVVEPRPGEWGFSTDELAKVKAEGFRIMGSFDTAPDFAADIDPNSAVRNRWCRSYPPKDIDAWKEYVTRCFTAFAPYIDVWEVWNEPDGGYLQVRPELTKSTVYLNLLKAAREALDATGKPAVLIGPALSEISSPLGWEVLDQGGGQWLDAASFHFYALAEGGDSPNDSLILTALDKYRTYQNRQGKTLPLWHTEGGPYIKGGQSWLATYRIPPSATMTPPQAAASMVRTALLFKAMGVSRHFVYEASASPTGRKVQTDACTGFIDVTGIPGPGIAAHAAMVSLTEDATPAGYEVVADSPERVKIAHFTRGQERIDVYWSGKPVALQTVAGLTPGDQVRDLMGNLVKPDDAMVGEYPLYVTRLPRRDDAMMRHHPFRH